MRTGWSVQVSGSDGLTTTTQLLESLKDTANARAWGDFVERYRPILLAVVLRMGLGSEDASDVVQQTFLEFVRDYRGQRYDRAKGKLRSWLIGIAKHRALDVVRADARHRVSRGESAIVELPDDESLTKRWEEERDKAIAAEAMTILRSESQMSEINLRIFELAVLNKSPAAIVAQECGVAVQQVYLVTNRGKAQMRKIIERLSAAYEDGP